MTGNDNHESPPEPAATAAVEPEIEIAVTIEQPAWGEVFADQPDDAPEAVLGPVVRAALAAGGMTAALGRPVEVGIVLADDALAQQLNHEYRGIDAPTNVLSFPQRPDRDAAPGDAAATEIVPGTAAEDSVAEDLAEVERAEVERAEVELAEVERAEVELAEAELDGPDFVGAPAPLLLGDVVLAYETVLAEAEAQGKSPLDHLYHLVVHGVLHLIGYDHDTDAEAETMERLEADVLARFGIADPTASDRPPAAPDRPQ